MFRPVSYKMNITFFITYYISKVNLKNLNIKSSAFNWWNIQLKFILDK